MSKLNELSILEASAKLAVGEVTSVQLVEACLAEIEKRNPSLNAFLEVFADAREQAKKADERRAAGEKGALLGIPLAIKDNILIEGRTASAASKILEHYVASYDATVIAKLKKEGVVFIGRTNMDEFAMGGSNENSAFGPAHNPHDESRVTGGSSGGSAAAVAAGMALGALGSDTGGSVREPAAFCGIVGMKPTYGAVSRAGLMAMGSSLDQIGPLTKTVADAELVFSAIKGKDPLDSTSIENPNPQKTTTKKIGVPRGLLAKGVDPDVLAHFNESLTKLETAGYEIVDIDLPSAPLALAVYYVIMPAEVSTNLARFDGVRYGLSRKGSTLLEDYALSRGEGFGPEVRRRIMLGTYVLSAGYYDAYFGKATAARALLRDEFEGVLKNVDAIATPTAPFPAWKIGEKSDPLSVYLADIFTVTANLTGNPAISVPMGTVERDGTQLPVGIQLTAAHGDEAALFAVAKQIEK
jgi:aspartyl-tRNA(Asn)/glutamyl-tRNA(Gln) amidotransferase subunit A